MASTIKISAVIIFATIQLHSLATFSQNSSSLNYEDQMAKINSDLTSGNFAEAKQKADNLVKEASNEFGVISGEYAVSLFLLGNCLRYLGNSENAISAYKQSLEILQKVDTAGTVVISITGTLGDISTDIGAYTEAEKYLLKAVSLCEEKKIQNKLLYMPLGSLGKLYWTLGKSELAAEYYQKSIELIPKNEFNDLGTTYSFLSLLFLECGDFEKAESYYNLSIKNYEKSDPLPLYYISRIKNNYVALLARKGQINEALRLNEEIQKEYVGIFSSEDINTNNNNLGVIFLDAGYYELAKPLLQQVLANREKTLGENHINYISSLDQIGRYYNLIGDFGKAQYYFDIGINLCERNKYFNALIFQELLLNSTDNLESIGDSDKANAIIEKVINVVNDSMIKNEYVIARIDHAIGKFYTNVGESEKAEEYLLQALEKMNLSVGKSHPDYISVLGSLAVHYHYLHKYEDALKIRIKIAGYYNNNFKNHSYSASNWYSIATIFDDMKEYEQAKKDYYLAVHIFKLNDLEGTDEFNNILFRLVDLYRVTSKIDSSCIIFSNLRILERNSIVRKLSSMSFEEKEDFISSQKYSFDWLNSKYYQFSSHLPYITEKWFNDRLFLKELLLETKKEFFKEWKLKQDTSFLKSYNEWIMANRQLEKLYESKDNKSPSQIDSLKTTIGIKEKILLSNMDASDASNSTWEMVRTKINHDEAIVEIVRFKLHNYGWNWTDSLQYAALILTSETTEHPKLILLKNGNDLDRTYFLRYQQYLTNPKQWEDIDYESYQYFWAAIDSAIGDKKIVYVSPDGVYNKINLETLVTPDGKYLSDSKDIRIICSSRDLLQPVSPVKKSIKNALLVGNPNFSTSAIDTTLLAFQNSASTDVFRYTTRSFENTNLTPLPASEKEVKSISDILKKYNYQTTTLIGNTAQEAAVKSASSPSILHIATHGFFEKDIKPVYDERFFEMNRKKQVENPMLRSGLLLAGAEKTIKGNYDPKDGTENGILTAYEVQQMNLDSTELVVLSACETGLGEVKNGEGVYGLQRAFRIAGAKTIIMSLWKVDDEATQLLMTSFYENWLSGKTKREAFKTAQETLKKNLRYNYPYYWGAFVLIGE